MARDDAAPFVDLRAERAVLGAIMLDERQERGSYALAAQILRCARTSPKWNPALVTYEGDFGEPRHNVIFACMGEVLARGEALDVATVVDELRRARASGGTGPEGLLNTVGGAQYIGELTDEFLPLAHLESHARLVRRLADCRHVDAALSRARTALRSEPSPDDAMARALDVVRLEVESGSSRGGPRPYLEHAVDVWEAINSASKGDTCPFEFGLPGLDAITGGFAPGQVVTIAGMQGRGKTAFLSQILEHNARALLQHAHDHQQPTKRILWWSLEMSGAEMLIRHAAWDCGVTQASIRNGTLGPDGMALVGNSFNRRSQLPIDFDGESDPSAIDIRAHTYAAPATAIVAVDWIGLLRRHPDAPPGAKDHDLVRLNMKSLKTLARTRQVAVVICNQFTQEGNRGGKPSMHDMLGGASVVNDSDVILVMHADKGIGGTVSPISIRVEKSRGSKRDVVDAVFDSSTGRFSEVARPAEDPQLPLEDAAE